MNNDREDLRERAGKFVAHVQHSVAQRPGERSALRRALGRHPGDTAIRPAARRVLTPHLQNLHNHQRDPVERAFYAVAALIAAQPRRVRDEHYDDASSPEEGGDGGQIDGSAADHVGPDPHDPSTEGEKPAANEVLLDLGSALGQSAIQAARARRPGAQESTHGEETSSAHEREAPQEKRLHLLCRQDLDGLHRHLPRVVGFLRSESISVDWARLACDLASWGEGGPNGRNRVAKQWLDGYYRVVSRDAANWRREQKAGRPDPPTPDGG